MQNIVAVPEQMLRFYIGGRWARTSWPRGRAAATAPATRPGYSAQQCSTCQSVTYIHGGKDVSRTRCSGLGRPAPIDRLSTRRLLPQHRAAAWKRKARGEGGLMMR